MQLADCLVLPSYYETFGVVLIEALSSGIPFIATNCGGANDIHEDGLGYLISKGDRGKLREAMYHFIKGRANFSSEYIRSVAVQKYGRDSVTNRIMEIYDQMLKSSNK